MIRRGSVVLVDLDPARGHEQRGSRPCVVVSSSAVNAAQRYPVMAVVPVTGTEGSGALYPMLRPGPSGIQKPSWALVDQIRTIDKGRISRAFGVVAPEEMAAIDEGLVLFLGL
jgi:mRNA interferase MazF